MNALPITSILSAFFTLFYIGLSLRVVRVRRKNRIPLGDGQNPDLMKAISIHSNFSQYIPFALFLILLQELQNGSQPWLLSLGIALFVGRVCHIIGIVYAKTGPNIYRVVGMVMTFSLLGILAGSLILTALKQM